MAEPIDLYFWPTPNGWKITIMLEECALPYRICHVDLSKGEQLKEDFLRISPNGRMPAIVDPDGPGGTPISIFESGAILQYLGDKAGKFYPADRRARTKVEQWLFWQKAGLGPMAGQAAHFNYQKEKIAYAIDRYTNESRRLYGVIDRRLVESEYLADAYSIADISTWPWIRGYKALGIDLAEFPHVQRWFKLVGGREAVRKGSSIGKEEFAARQRELRA
jgi:GSH-dependent disulfide-bond oxidoreductase